MFKIGEKIRFVSLDTYIDRLYKLQLRQNRLSKSLIRPNKFIFELQKIISGETDIIIGFCERQGCEIIYYTKNDHCGQNYFSAIRMEKIDSKE